MRPERLYKTYPQRIFSVSWADSKRSDLHTYYSSPDMTSRTGAFVQSEGRNLSGLTYPQRIFTIFMAGSKRYNWQIYYSSPDMTSRTGAYVQSEGRSLSCLTPPQGMSINILRDLHYILGGPEASR